jgi:hypothetical protein
MATVFSQFDFQLYDTSVEDVDIAHAYLLPMPKWESKGVRAIVESHS